MNEAYDIFLSRHGGVAVSELRHSERTLQDEMDDMTPEKKEAQAHIVGAALSDVDLSDDVIKEYNSFSDVEKMVTAFLVGNILAEESNSLKQSDMGLVENFLAHFGVKGMRWGVTTSRSSARAKVKSGGATLGEAHGAALKSTGHRAINAFTGDKTFWKRTAITAGVAVTVAAAATAAPLVLPTSTLVAIGASVTGSTSVAGVGLVSGSLVNLAEVGAATIFSAGVSSATVGAGAATIANVVGNTYRAVAGNSKINKSYASLGQTMSNRQNTGTKRINKMLNKEGSIAKRDLKHEGVDLDSFIAHHASTKLSFVE